MTSANIPPKPRRRRPIEVAFAAALFGTPAVGITAAIARAAWVWPLSKVVVAGHVAAIVLFLVALLTGRRSR
ncbi:hypothetical protein ACIBTV_25435 [Micromonospora sp. NPDC049366]|uniref:hypothetical protein n=1 Tax=Micromonospora sp. NPDC049366 TaxID=3364271 RepID=UPI0037A9BDD9